MQPEAANNNTPRPAEFDARVMAYMPALKKLAIKLVPAGQREDLIQDVLLWALANWRKFRPDGGFYNWLTLNMRGIAQNKRRSAEARARTAPLADDPYMRRAAAVGAPATQEDGLAARDVIAKLARSREGRVMIRRGLGDTLAEVGKRRGIGAERARQIEMRGRAKYAELAA